MDRLQTTKLHLTYPMIDKKMEIIEELNKKLCVKGIEKIFTCETELNFHIIIFLKTKIDCTTKNFDIGEIKGYYESATVEAVVKVLEAKEKQLYFVDKKFTEILHTKEKELNEMEKKLIAKENKIKYLKLQKEKIFESFSLFKGSFISMENKTLSFEDNISEIVAPNRKLNVYLMNIYKDIENIHIRIISLKNECQRNTYQEFEAISMCLSKLLEDLNCTKKTNET
jgi:hypothetical protein